MPTDQTTCSCDHHCTTRAEMVERHGTPESFEASLRRALGEISVDEYNDALARYRYEWSLLK